MNIPSSAHDRRMEAFTGIVPDGGLRERTELQVGSSFMHHFLCCVCVNRPRAWLNGKAWGGVGGEKGKPKHKSAQKQTPPDLLNARSSDVKPKPPGAFLLFERQLYAPGNSFQDCGRSPTCERGADGSTCPVSCRRPRLCFFLPLDFPLVSSKVYSSHHGG